MHLQETFEPIDSQIHLATQLAITPVADWTAIGQSEHFVQFYEADSSLVESVAAFLASGFRTNRVGVVIATDEHRQSIHERLRLEGVDPDQEVAAGNYFLLDAAETLSKFMVDDWPDPGLFKQVIGGLMMRVDSYRRPVLAFGEMVALLVAQGKTEAAIKLEELWNQLAKDYRFSLFCAYPMAGFSSLANGEPFTHICNAHSRVIPSESYTRNGTADERLRVITSLQQKAACLDSEVDRRKETESALCRRERELSDFLESASEGIHQVAQDGRILWANKAELELLGYASTEYIGQDIRKFHADAEVIEDILQRLGRGENLHEFEARLRHKDGSVRHVSINSNVYREGDQFLYTRCFTRDITERKRAADVLERTIAERTAELRATVTELEAFSYSISHDMRSPLRAMDGYARTLLKDYGALLPPPAAQCLERIQRAASRLDMLVRDVLAYSRLGKQEIQLKPVALNQLLEDLLQQHPELQAAGNSITIEQPLHTVWGHEALLTQCLSNLIENGLKFVEAGAIPYIRICSQACDDTIRVSVSDNGIGIAPEHRDRIFQIFGRIHSDKRYPGTGIGLAIVKRAVSRMRGEAGFESQPGQGSTFWFTLSPAPQ